MDLLCHPESLYNQAELIDMDRIIHQNMDSHLQQLIESQMAALMQKQMNNFKPPSSLLSNQSLEENVCMLVNQLSQNWADKQENYQQENSQHKKEKLEMAISISEKQHLIGTLNSSIKQKDEAIVQLNKQNHQLNTMVYILKQEINTEKSKSLSEASKYQEEMHAKMAEMQRLLGDLSQKTSENENLLQQNQRLKEQWDLMKEQLCGLEQWLVDDLHHVNLNSITSNILANSINETHQQNLRQLEKYVAIHNQYVQVAKLLENVSRLARAELIELEQPAQTKAVYSMDQLDKFHHLLRQMQERLIQYETKMNHFMGDYKQLKTEISLKSNSIQALHKDYQRVCTQLQSSISQCKTLHETLNKQRSEHYNTLMDVQKNKGKLQALLFQNLNEHKNLQQRCTFLQQTIRQKDISHQQLLQKLQKNQIQKQQLWQALKEEQKTSYELRQEMLNMKSNLEIMLKTQGDDEDASFNIVQQLIDKNNDITGQLTLKKMEIDLKEQKIAYQERLIDQANQQIEALYNELGKLKMKTTQTQKLLSDKTEENKIYLRDIQILKEKVVQLNNRPAKVITKDLKNIEIQTEQVKAQPFQSRIKRQGIKKSVGCSIQKSHSLLSQRQQNKQNSEHLNKNLVNTRQKDYKEKIMTLNQIINFMMNYAKGLSHGQLCRGSWFMNQINKYGQEYEEKLMDSGHLGPKIKNAKFIEGLCRQDGSCSKLVKEFQAIIDFYTSCSSKLNSSHDGSSIQQDRLNKTINKSRHPQPFPFF